MDGSCFPTAKKRGHEEHVRLKVNPSSKHSTACVQTAKALLQARERAGRNCRRQRLRACFFFCFVCVCVCLSVCLSVGLSVCLAGCLAIWLSVCLSVWLSVCLCVCVWGGGGGHPVVLAVCCRFSARGCGSLMLPCPMKLKL